MKTTFKPFRETKSKAPKSNTPKQQKQKPLKLSKGPVELHKDASYALYYKTLKRNGLA